ncbi:hypothetical protein AAVH_40637 [Aphelenchoides avenae]|nr:hypothetical protein AAVH_40637 [Aphelenchus avenae]
MKYFRIFALSAAVGSVACYVIIWLYVRFSLANVGADYGRLFRSLAVIALFVTGCFGVTYLIAVIYGDGENAPFVHLYNGVVVNIGCSCNYFVLYAMSSEYRAAFVDGRKNRVVRPKGDLPPAIP